MKTLITSIFLLAIPALVFCQDAEAKKATRFLYHSHGVSFQKFKNLNQRVTTNNLYEPVGNNVATFQFGFIAERKNFFYNTGLTIGSSFTGKKNTRSTNIKVLEYNVDIGYNILQSNRFIVAPILGLGYSMYNVRYFRDLSSIPFDTIVASVPAQSQTGAFSLENSFINYRAGLNLTVKSTRNNHSAVALQVGYVHSFSDNDWKVNKFQTLANSPNDALSKVFTNLVFRYQLGVGKDKPMGHHGKKKKQAV